MKNTLAENMLRFGVKNLQETEIKKIEKLAEQGYMGNVAPDQKGASLPPVITLASDSQYGFSDDFVLGAIFRLDGDSSSDYIWDVQVDLKGIQGKLVTDRIKFIPRAPKLLANKTKTVEVPLQSPISLLTPIDYKIYKNKPEQLIKVQFKNDANLKQVADSLELSNFNKVEEMQRTLPYQIFNSLVGYCREKGWYTGPSQPVAKQYAIFTNFK